MRKAVALVALLGALVPSGARATVTPQVVIALIDVGINPYSDAFRDPSPLAMQPPSTYLPNYPPDCPSPLQPGWEPTTSCAIALPITFGLPVAQAYAADRARWDTVERRQLYYIPGTSIVGALSFGSGISRCRMEFGPVVVPGPPPPLTATGASCVERKILDDAGHGTMVASRAAGAPNSLAGSGARIVMIEGLGSASSEWAADQPWIDVQSNSWGSLLPPAIDTTDETFMEIAQQQLVFVASGNGLAGNGVAPLPTWLDPLAAKGVILVGGHDNGRIAPWAGIPAHVVADAFAGYTAIHTSTEAMRPDPVACCTSAASPYAAGGGAAILLRAREILGDANVGVHGGVVASGPAGMVPGGPLADGVFTLDELRTVVLHSAQARPAEGRDDGAVNFVGRPGIPWHPEYGLGENPYCAGCVTLPVPWTSVPAEIPAYEQIGYGAINEFSVATAYDVLSGVLTITRPEEDAYFEHVEEIRRRTWGQ